MSSLIYAPRSIGLFTNGVFTGIGICMNFVCVPAIKASKDPLPVFYQVYHKTSVIAIANIFGATAANAICYYRTKDTRFIYSAVLSFISFPFTILFIRPVNNQLFALHENQGNNYDCKKVQHLVNKWNNLQYFRTLTGAAAFVINILYH